MKKIQRMKNGRKYLAFFLIFAILFGMSDFSVMAATLSDKMEDPFSQEFDPETAEWLYESSAALEEIAREREIMALVYLSDEYPVREQPSYESQAVVSVCSGQLVYIEDVYVSLDEEENPEVWHYVRLDRGGTEYAGYVPRHYLAVSDERFLSWEEAYGLDFQTSAYAIDNAGNKVYEDIERFPASYRPALTALKEKHPSWQFVAFNTNLDWQTVIDNELTGDRSMVYYTFPAYTKEGLYDQGTWYYASEAVLKQYMDPRNALTENAIFQFELLTYNATCHTEAAVDSFLQNTFMKKDKNAPGTQKTYGRIFWEAGQNQKVSPFHLAARVYQEQGKGDSPLISGTYPGYAGYYNYFNIAASGRKTAEVIEKGLAYAKQEGWSNAEASILGGAQVISDNYIKKEQYTLYLQKYNVNPNNRYNPLYTHQYMQNISAPTTEALSIKNLYEGAGVLDNSFVFHIPVFANMPETPCAAPTSSTNVALPVPSGYKDTTVWLDGVPYAAVVRNGHYIVQAPDTKAKTAVVYQYSGSVPVGMYLWTLEYKNNAYTVTAQPELANLLTYHGFSIRITGKPGIRFKTGISADLRRRLTSTGVGGYTLKEYGTLVMYNAYRNQNPMVLGGSKVSAAMAYGINASGVMEDNVFETVDGRYRYTSVLVGLPVDQYKAEYAFRGYAILERGGSRITVYGPVVAKSIYSLADQLLKGGSYAEGTDVYKFLKKLMSDADAL